jgi:hypothetical protein
LGVKLGSLALLLAGTVLTQLSEISRASLGGGATTTALMGGALTVAGAALSALPNVLYEKVTDVNARSRNVPTPDVGAWWMAGAGTRRLFDLLNSTAVMRTWNQGARKILRTTAVFLVPW